MAREREGLAVTFERIVVADAAAVASFLVDARRRMIVGLEREPGRLGRAEPRLRQRSRNYAWRHRYARGRSRPLTAEGQLGPLSRQPLLASSRSCTWSR
jgi:hypothetical protein